MELFRDIYRVVSLLLENDLPHNLVMIKAPPFSRRSQQQPQQSTSADSQKTTVDDHDGATVIRSILVPRKPAYGSYNFVALMSFEMSRCKFTMPVFFFL